MKKIFMDRCISFLINITTHLRFMANRMIKITEGDHGL